MPAGNTYEAIASVTAPGGSSSQLVMSSIPNTYTDLVLVASCRSSIAGTGNVFFCRINGDSASNYSYTTLGGDGSGSSAFSERVTTDTYCRIGIHTSAASASDTFATNVIHFMNYADTTTYKTIISRGASAQFWAFANVALWRKTPEAITSITVFPAGLNNWIAGSTFTLYGIKAD